MTVEVASTPAGQAGAWRIDVFFHEDGKNTTAHAVLHTGANTRLDSRGAAHRSPQDADVPKIGDEVAAARALRRLADVCSMSPPTRSAPSKDMRSTSVDESPLRKLPGGR